MQVPSPTSGQLWLGKGGRRLYTRLSEAADQVRLVGRMGGMAGRIVSSAGDCARTPDLGATVLIWLDAARLQL
jgi:hypothetical protein